jgi:hypothetical protein
MFSLHRDEETKTALSKPTQTICVAVWRPEISDDPLAPLHLKKQPKMHKNRNATKRKTI